MDGEISPDAVSELIEQGDGEDGNGEERLSIVDIRDERSFERGHIPGSVNLPFQELTARVDEVADADRIVTVCPHGKASVQAARLIGSYEGSADARVESMAGGLTEWAESFELVGGAETSERTDEASAGGSAETAADGADAPF